MRKNTKRIPYHVRFAFKWLMLVISSIGSSSTADDDPMFTFFAVDSDA